MPRRPRDRAKRVAFNGAVKTKDNLLESGETDLLFEHEVKDILDYRKQGALPRIKGLYSFVADMLCV